MQSPLSEGLLAYIAIVLSRLFPGRSEKILSFSTLNRIFLLKFSPLLHHQETTAQTLSKGVPLLWTQHSQFHPLYSLIHSFPFLPNTHALIQALFIFPLDHLDSPPISQSRASFISFRLSFLTAFEQTGGSSIGITTVQWQSHTDGSFSRIQPTPCMSLFLPKYRSLGFQLILRVNDILSIAPSCCQQLRSLYVSLTLPQLQTSWGSVAATKERNCIPDALSTHVLGTTMTNIPSDGE